MRNENAVMLCLAGFNQGNWQCLRIADFDSDHDNYLKQICYAILVDCPVIYGHLGIVYKKDCDSSVVHLVYATELNLTFHSLSLFALQSTGQTVYSITVQLRLGSTYWIEMILLKLEAQYNFFKFLFHVLFYFDEQVTCILLLSLLHMGTSWISWGKAVFWRQTQPSLKNMARPPHSHPSSSCSTQWM